MSKPISLRILIDEEKNKVLFPQAGKDFMDILLSFLTFPLATIARLVNTESNMHKVSFGSISTLYESVANLEEQQFWTPACKKMLLQPKNSMVDYYQNLKHYIDVTEETSYFICEDWYCSRESSGGLLTTFSNLKCRCGKFMSSSISLSGSDKIDHSEGFVTDATTFNISDDLSVKPDSFQNSICQPMNLLGLENFNAIKFMTVEVTKKEILDLLKCALISKTPLTDIFLLKKQNLESPLLNTSVLDLHSNIVEENESKKLKIKAMLRKSNNKILFALGDADFADFILSLLTFPLGGVEHMLKGNSCDSSIDNFYKSIVELDSDTYLRSSDLKDKLVKSKLAHQFKLCDQLLPFEETPAIDYFIVSRYNRRKTGFHGYLTAFEEPSITSKELCVPLKFVEPQSSIGEEYGECGGRGFMKGPALYMVTDDLVVTQSTSVSVISFLSKLGVPSSDLEEKVITIGKKEGLSILKASLMSCSALTNGLGPFLKVKVQTFVKVKDENISN
ncbi:uncharacterized protein LOC123891988 [Trifolium pratense]|uniref:uncharacterized protein LOC123891988 n=1 Tax=Trifolium pratense TaxID=57577 RepID=UPI001E695623|nr:uncharacterized protein LOC123891988 [Trifolium pratense]